VCPEHSRFFYDDALYKSTLSIYLSIDLSIRKVEDLELILLIIVFSLSSLHLLSKKHLKQLFCYTFFTHNRFMDVHLQ